MNATEFLSIVRAIRPDKTVISFEGRIPILRRWKLYSHPNIDKCAVIGIPDVKPPDQR